MQWVELIFVKILTPIAWPVALVSLCIWFHKDIRDLIRRGTKIGPTGFEAVPPKQSAELVDDVVHQGLQQELDLPLEPILEPWESPIREDVNRFKSRNVPTELILNLVVRDLSLARQRIAYETITRQIFATQIEFLKRLEDGAVHSRESLDDIYAEHLRRWSPHANFEPTFDLWINFLVKLYLVNYLPEGYQITPQGRAYLEFLRRERIVPTSTL